MEMDVVYDGQEFDGPAGKIRYSFETFKEINWNDAVERTRMQNMQLVLDTVGNHPDFYVTKSSIVLHVDGRPTNGGMIVVSVKKQGHAKIFDVFSGRNSVVSLGDAIDYIRKLKMACTPYLTESRRAILRRGISVYYAYADMLWSRGQIIASGTVYEINGERDMYSFDGFISKYNLQTE
jgi:hypothetical protein